MGSTYLLSGLVKCHKCKRALSGQDAKSGQFAYYVCQSLIKQGSGACDSPRLNARRFEELVVEKIRSNILTEGSITSLVKVVDEEMDGIAAEQRQRLETCEALSWRRSSGSWPASGTSSRTATSRWPTPRTGSKEHRERQERLEEAAAEARAILAERRAVLDDVETIAAYARDMRDFLVESELTERRAFIESFVKEVVVTTRRRPAALYRAHARGFSMIPGGATERVALDGAVLPTFKIGGHILTIDRTVFEMWLVYLAFTACVGIAGTPPLSWESMGPPPRENCICRGSRIPAKAGMTRADWRITNIH